MCRVNLDLPAIARTIPAATRMLCLHGAADTVVPPEARCWMDAGCWCWCCRGRSLSAASALRGLLLPSRRTGAQQALPSKLCPAP